jgi:hypothetical protein
MVRGYVSPCFAAAAAAVVGVTGYIKEDHLQLWGCLALSLKCLGRHIFRQ